MEGLLCQFYSLEVLLQMYTHKFHHRHSRHNCQPPADRILLRYLAVGIQELFDSGIIQWKMSNHLPPVHICKHCLDKQALSIDNHFSWDYIHTDIQVVHIHHNFPVLDGMLPRMCQDSYTWDQIASHILLCGLCMVCLILPQIPLHQINHTYRHIQAGLVIQFYSHQILHQKHMYISPDHNLHNFHCRILLMCLA